jgi:hypothetical protein
MVDIKNCTLTRSSGPPLLAPDFVFGKSACAEFQRGVMPAPVPAHG